MTVDNCKRVALCFDDVIASAEAINSQGVQIQVTLEYSRPLAYIDSADIS